MFTGLYKTENILIITKQSIMNNLVIVPPPLNVVIYLLYDRLNPFCSLLLLELYFPATMLLLLTYDIHTTVQQKREWW